MAKLEPITIGQFFTLNVRMITPPLFFWRMLAVRWLLSVLNKVSPIAISVTPNL